MHKNKLILRAIHKAIFWKTQMDDDSTKTLSSIANEENLSVRYVRNIYRLNYLMPMIVKSLIKNENPKHLTINDFREDFPLSWAEQYKWFFGEE